MRYQLLLVLRTISGEVSVCEDGPLLKCAEILPSAVTQQDLHSLARKEGPTSAQSGGYSGDYGMQDPPEAGCQCTIM